MNAIDKARQAYASNQIAIHTDRTIEAQVLAGVTARLAQTAMKRQRHYSTFVQAIHANRQVWMTLAVSVADQNNNLPKAIRANIFYLAEFVNIYSSKVLNNDESVSPLIDINTAVMRGLRGQDIAQ